MTTETAEQVHVFEAAGLGKAPFRFVGLAYQHMAYGMRVIGQVRGVEISTTPGGSCAYCGTAITNMYNIESADGNQFHVGCECVNKANDAGLKKQVDAARKLADKAKREQGKRDKATSDRELCLGYQIGLLASQPHPHPALAADGMTLFDWAKFMILHKNYGTLANVIRRNMAGK